MNKKTNKNLRVSFISLISLFCFAFSLYIIYKTPTEAGWGPVFPDFSGFIGSIIISFLLCLIDLYKTNKAKYLSIILLILNSLIIIYFIIFMSSF